MSSYPRNLRWAVWGLLLLTALVVTLALAVSTFRILGPPLPVLGEIKPFTLTNQLGQPVTLDALRGKVWVADLVFTRCPGPCLKMSQQMAELIAAVNPDSPVRFVSLTADPSYDTPEVLRAYSRRFPVSGDRWWFLTGPKREVYRFAMDDLKLGATELKPEERKNPDDLFIHSTYFVLVDKQGRLRGRADQGLEPGVKKEILFALKKLGRE